MVAFKYHAGKLAVQRKSGALEDAAGALNAGWVGTTLSSSGESQLADPDMKEVYLSSVDQDGLVWASVVGGAPGFVSVAPSPTTHDTQQVSISSGGRGFLTYKGDPLDQNLRRPNAPVGMLIMGYKNRRRYRIDGRVASTTGGGGDNSSSSDGKMETPLLSGLVFDITMCMGNCPKYLHVRQLVQEEQPAPMTPPLERSASLSQRQRDWIASATTFTLGTYASGRDGGADVSNRGGNPGFVRALDDRTIVFPDYKGNNLYLSLGNIAANPRAGLLFINRDTGDILQVSGKARIVYVSDGSGGGANVDNSDLAFSGSTGKYLEIAVLVVVEARGASPLRMRIEQLSPFSPPVPPYPPLSPSSTAAAADGSDAVLQAKQQQRQTASFLVRCTEILDVATGIKAFRFRLAVEPAPATEITEGTTKEGDSHFKSLSWTPGQYATFFFPSRGGVRYSTERPELFTLPTLRSLSVGGGGGGGDKGEGEVVMRTWTITSVDGAGGSLEITVQAKAGGVSEHLHSDLRPGCLARVAIGGDFTVPGRMGAPPNSDSKILLLSAGIGFTPMIAALRWLRQREAKRLTPDGKGRCVVPGHPDVVVVHAARKADAVPFLAEIIDQAKLAATPSSTGAAAASDHDAARTKIRLVLAITGGGGGSDRSTSPQKDRDGSSDTKKQRTAGNSPDEGNGFAGAAGDAPVCVTVTGRPDAGMLRVQVPDVADRHVLLCGPGAFMTAMDGALRELGVPSRRIHAEEFSF